MNFPEYQERIVQYYKETEHAYADSWALEKSLAIHYGYWDEKVKNFPASLKRMNEVMMEGAFMAAVFSWQLPSVARLPASH
jgi:hypothetical protein